MMVSFSRAVMLCGISIITLSAAAQRKPNSPVKIPAPRDANYKNNYNKYVNDEAKFNHAYIISGEQVTMMTKISPTVRIYNAIDGKGKRLCIYVPVNSMLYDLWSDKLYAQEVTDNEMANGDQPGFTPPPITPISTAEAQRYIWNYIGNKKVDDINSFVVNTQTLYMYINRVNSNHYVRYYHAMDDHGQRYLICYGVDKNWNDMTDVQYLMDRTSLCTKTCEGYEMPRPNLGTGLATSK
jgi:hypothetical protein